MKNSSGVNSGKNNNSRIVRKGTLGFARSVALAAAFVGTEIVPAADAGQEGNPAARVEASGGGASDVAIGTTQSLSYQSTDGDGRVVELRVENGRVTSAMIDGERIPAERVRKAADGYDILAEDGTVLRHVAVSVRAATEAAASARRAGQSSGDAARAREARVRVLRAGEPQSPEARRSMIGVGLGEPDEALAHHLKIDPARSTMVTNVVGGLPAAAAGIEQFDVIVSVNGDGDASGSNLRRVLGACVPGSKVVLGIVRGVEQKTVEIVPVAFDQARLETAAADSDGDVGPDGMRIDELDQEALGMDGLLDGTGFSRDGDADRETRMFFIGPDGRRREMRIPAMRGLPVIPGFEALPNEMWAERSERFERLQQKLERTLDDMGRRLEELSRRMETERMERERGERARGEQGRVDGGLDAPRGEQGGAVPTDERLRRMEERLDQLMRDLERRKDAGVGRG